MKTPIITVSQLDDLHTFLTVAETCADWMLEAHKGTDQYERGQDLMREVKKNRAHLKTILRENQEYLANPFK